MLTLDRISKYHGANPILLDVTLGVPPGGASASSAPTGSASRRSCGSQPGWRRPTPAP